MSKANCDDCLITERMEGVLGVASLIGNDVETQGMVRQIEERRRSIGDSSISSSTKTKTKTAQLSGNGYSVEMAKISRPRLDQVVIEQRDNHVTEVNQCELSPLESDGSAPPGFGIVTVSPVRKAKATKELNGPSTAKRVTRSQVKKGREQIRRNQVNLDRITSNKTIRPDKKRVDVRPVTCG